MLTSFEILLDEDVYNYLDSNNIQLGSYKSKYFPYPHYVCIYPDGKTEDLIDVIAHVMCEEHPGLPTIKRNRFNKHDYRLCALYKLDDVPSTLTEEIVTQARK